MRSLAHRLDKARDLTAQSDRTDTDYPDVSSGQGSEEERRNESQLISGRECMIDKGIAPIYRTRIPLDAVEVSMMPAKTRRGIWWRWTSSDEGKTERTATVQTEVRTWK